MAHLRVGYDLLEVVLIEPLADAKSKLDLDSLVAVIYDSDDAVGPVHLLYVSVEHVLRLLAALLAGHRHEDSVLARRVIFYPQFLEEVLYLLHHRNLRRAEERRGTIYFHLACS